MLTLNKIEVQSLLKSIIHITMPMEQQRAKLKAIPKTGEMTPVEYKGSLNDET